MPHKAQAAAVRGDSLTTVRSLLRLCEAGVGVGITSEPLARIHTVGAVVLPFMPKPLQFSVAIAWSPERGPHTRALGTYLDFATAWYGSR